MNSRIILLTFLTIVSLVSCDSKADDVLSPPEAPLVNNNSNSSTGRKYAMSLEMPHFNNKNVYVSHDTVVAAQAVHNFSFEWNTGLKHAQWVAYKSDKSNAQNNSVGRTVQGDFLTDWLVSTSPVEADHKSDGFDKGHLLPSADRQSCKELNFQTYYLTNMSPMEHNFNAGFWESLEAQCRRWCRTDVLNAKWDTVYQVRGGNLNKLRLNYTSSVKGQDGKYPQTDAKGLSKGGIAVPAYYFVAVLARKGNKFQAIGFYVEHDPNLPKQPTRSQLQEKVVSIRQLEELTGLDFFCNLDDKTEKEVESNVDISAWNW